MVISRESSSFVSQSIYIPGLGNTRSCNFWAIFSSKLSAKHVITAVSLLIPGEFDAELYVEHCPFLHTVVFVHLFLVWIKTMAAVPWTFSYQILVAHSFVSSSKDTPINQLTR